MACRTGEAAPQGIAGGGVEVTAALLVDPTRGSGGFAGGVPPYVWTACRNERCRVFGVRRQVWLPQIAVGVVAVPTLLCQACGHVLPLNLFEEETVPKLHAGRPPTSRHDVKPKVVEAPKLATGGVVKAPMAGERGLEELTVGPVGVEVVKPKVRKQTGRRAKGG